MEQVLEVVKERAKAAALRLKEAGKAAIAAEIEANLDLDVDAILDAMKAAIPGQFDDVVIEALRTHVKALLKAYLLGLVD